jgi:hypothetical protein
VFATLGAVHLIFTVLYVGLALLASFSGLVSPMTMTCGALVLCLASLVLAGVAISTASAPEHSCTSFVYVLLNVSIVL